MAKTSVIQLRQHIKDITDELIYECGVALLTKVKDTYDAKYRLTVSEPYVYGILAINGYSLDQDLLGGWYARLHEIQSKTVDR